jgi:hypothetical protein
MKVYSLHGVWTDGETLLGIFGTQEDMLEFIEKEKVEYMRQTAPWARSRAARVATLGYVRLGYVVAELGQAVDFYAQVEWL